MSMKDILAARKAAELAKQGIAPVTTEGDTIDIPKEDVKEVPDTKETEVTVPATELAEPEAPIKPMTFAEKMAEKKRLLTGEAAPKKEVATKEVAMISALEDGNTEETDKELPVITLSKEQAEQAAGAESEEIAQAYTDIVMKINGLSHKLDDTSLTHAMNDLKKALHKNPSASLLLLDPDIGQMVLALCKITKEASDTGSAPKKAKAKGSKMLTADEITKAFEELDDF